MKRIALLVAVLALSACVRKHESPADSARAVDSAHAVDSVKADSTDTLTVHQ